jgi:hypothetical protein
LLDAAVVIDPGVEKIAPTLVGLHAYPHAGRQLHPWLMQHLEFAERRVLLDCGQPQIDREDHAIGPAGLHCENAVVARLQCNDRRRWRKAAGGDLVHRADIDRYLDLGFVEVAPILGVEALLADHAEAVQVESMREVDDERPFWRWVEREGQIDLVGLQIEHRIAVSRFEIFDLAIENTGDVLGHLDAHACPSARGDVLVEIGRLAGQSGDPQNFTALDPVDCRLRGLFFRPGSAGKDRRSARRPGGEQATRQHVQPPLLLWSLTWQT